MGPGTYIPLTLHFSDGVDTGYPRQIEKLIAEDGTYEYFRRVAENETKDLMWRTKTAKHLIEKYKGEEETKEKSYIFKSLPNNYQLYEHVKGRKDEKKKGGIEERRDTYLFGHPSGKRFRSPAEFNPHILYLAAQDGTPCGCVVCSKSGNAPTSIKKVPKKEAEVIQAMKVVALEERQKEQETSGWVFRKGEIVWVWLSDNPEAEEDDDDMLIDGDGGLWLAAIVAERPSFTTPYRKVRKTTGNFADIDMGTTPPTWQQGVGVPENTYTLQVCSGPDKLGQVLQEVPQHHIKPWLARGECALPPPSYTGKVEHPSIPQARRVAETFSLFDRVMEPTTASDQTTKIVNFQGAFIGAEKIYIYEPVRISSADDDDAEDVLVVDKIYTSTTPSDSGGSSDGRKRTTTITLFQGNVYTAYPSSTCRPLTPQQFAELPFRMKRSDGTRIIKWFIRNLPDERGECSLKNILGRWYEPEAVNEWIGSTGFSGGHPSTKETALRQKNVKRWVKNRADALALVSLNKIDLRTEGVVKPKFGRLDPPSFKTGADLMDIDQTAPENFTPGTSFKSVNLIVSPAKPGSISSSRKTPGKLVQSTEVDADEEDEEDEYEDELATPFKKYRRPGSEVLSKSPTKRLGT